MKQNLLIVLAFFNFDFLRLIVGLVIFLNFRNRPLDR